MTGVTAPTMIPDLHLIPGPWKIDGYCQAVGLTAAAVRRHPGQELLHVSYDWRWDNRVAARRLKEQTNRWLGEWRREQPDAKLILVGHSMGGLVARYFLECLEGWRDTRRVVTSGPPYRGCPVSLVQAPDLSCRRRPPCCPRRQAAVLPSIN